MTDAELDAMETWAETDVLRLIGAYRQAREVVRDLTDHLTDKGLDAAIIHAAIHGHSVTQEYSERGEALVKRARRVLGEEVPR